MICRRRLITATIGILLLAGFVRADMVSVCHRIPEQQPVRSVCGSSEARLTTLAGLYDKSILDDFALRAIPFPTDAATDIEQPAQVPHTTIELTGGPCSASLCLYALMGLGLCSAPHWIKRLYLGHIPEWYHDGGPFQIGHSFAATPESLCTLQVCDLEPPNETAEFLIPRYRLRTIISCWRKSQFTPDVIASRGPPSNSLFR